MTILIPLLLAAYAVLYAFAFTIPAVLHVDQVEQHPLFKTLEVEEFDPTQGSNLDAWLEKEEDVAIDLLLANIAPHGRNVQDAAPGTVIASPSKEHPDYYYQWVRDASITIGTVIELWDRIDSDAPLSRDLLDILDSWTTLQRRLQHTPNPSGTFEDNLSGLGEPKFQADGSAFTGSWGRPQRDGPALRALSLIKYIKAYNDTHPSMGSDEEGSEWWKMLYEPSLPADSVIKADLEYVSHHWRESGFDLWEEIQGLHLFTAMVQLAALKEGADLAERFQDTGAARWYSQQAVELEKFMTKFWDEDKGHLVETIQGNTGRSGLDCGILLGSLHSYKANEDTPYPPYSDELLLTLRALVEDQRSRFPINSAPEHSSTDAGVFSYGVGIGRYPEDRYTGTESVPGGGNPWFLCTSTVAEVLYTTSRRLSTTNELHITQRGLPFWTALLASSEELSNIKAGTYTPHSDLVFNTTIARLKEVGDSFLQVVKTHADAEGSLSEQFDRVTGYERGARDLTWSYGAFLEAVWAREGL